MLVSGMKTENKRRRIVLNGSASGSSAWTGQQNQSRMRNTENMRMGDEINLGVHQNENCGSGFTPWRQKPVPRLKQVRRVSLSVPTFGREAEHRCNDKLSRKRTILAWLIDSKMVPLNGRAFYMNMECNRVLCEGIIQRDGLLCICCNKLLNVFEFELHAGSKLNDPYRNIFIRTGSNLLKCQVDAWEKQGESGSHIIRGRENASDENDDTCGICGDGGELLCCDSCPSTFHQSCLGIQILPKGDWRCPNCQCSTCRGVGTAKEPLHECCQCDKKCMDHRNCFLAAGRIVDPRGITFCGQNCKELHNRLEDIVGRRKELTDGYSCFVNHRMDMDSKETLIRQTKRVSCISKLAVSLAVMEECFDPIVDPRTGIDMMKNVIFNCSSNLNRLNYSGFYTFTLESGDEIISAASIRFHGTKLAEMPFIGTRNMYRCRGMCGRLLKAIESILKSLGVEKLMIPSINGRVEKWKKDYCFKPIEGSLKKEMRYMNLLMFPDTVLLQKDPTVGYEKNMKS